MRDFFWQTVRYGLVGASATVLDAIGYVALTRGVPFFREQYLLANACSFAVAVVWAYAMHRRVTFRVRHGSHRAQFPRFLAVTLVGLALNSLVLHLGVAVFALYDLLAKAAALVVTAAWNFTGQKLWTFRPGGPYTGSTETP